MGRACQIPLSASGFYWSAMDDPDVISRRCASARNKLAQLMETHTLMEAFVPEGGNLPLQEA